jgi:predicted anti-sigma-YlaC factor YlaD
MKKNELSCKKVIRNLPEWLEGTPQNNPLIANHLANCAACLIVADQIHAAMEAAKPLPMPEHDPYFVTRFEARMEAREQQTAFSRLTILLRPAFGVAAVSVAIAGGVLLGNVVNNAMSNSEQQQQLMQFAAEYNLADQPTDDLIELIAEE